MTLLLPNITSFALAVGVTILDSSKLNEHTLDILFSFFLIKLLRFLAWVVLKLCMLPCSRMVKEQTEKSKEKKTPIKSNICFFCDNILGDGLAANR